MQSPNYYEILVKQRGVKHPEAFCLMLYKAKDGRNKLIWNSRDGVTPFIHIDEFGVEYTHINWQGDIYAPNHIPKVGDEIWVTATEELVNEKLEKYIRKYWNEGMSQIFENKFQDYKALLPDWCKEGAPWLFKVSAVEIQLKNPQGQVVTLTGKTK